MVRISGYGQTGPLKDRPGYGTVAEAMSGFAHPQRRARPAARVSVGVPGRRNRGDVRCARRRFERCSDAQRAGATGVQVVDVALFETLFRLIPLQIPTYDQLGIALKRPGNFLGSHGVLRGNLYETADGVYFIVSAIGPEPIRRVLLGAGADELAAGVRDAVRAGAKNRAFGPGRRAREVGRSELWRPYRCAWAIRAVSSALHAAAIVADGSSRRVAISCQFPDPDLGAR